MLSRTLSITKGPGKKGPTGHIALLPYTVLQFRWLYGYFSMTKDPVDQDRAQWCQPGTDGWPEPEQFIGLSPPSQDQPGKSALSACPSWLPVDWHEPSRPRPTRTAMSLEGLQTTWLAVLPELAGQAIP